ncbi:ribose 5-phosphate isomerase B [Pedobacter chitinilyticus]|uniref:Ribose 5-phosphate isomerase B n=1 Tax=Pedobacter chitinilyticus TaxID=2233776 RepID=A0A443YP61_9SPHI|nr:ribose 5-phosphate isomerase B [Pedobacter chitinilyticus]RWU05515.1 ribose 5-phosphate isomerase B [Pedobacter chitinilyticus]
MSTTNSIKLAIGADHAGFEYKEILKAFLADYQVTDFGTHSLDSVDYPDFAHPVASSVEKGEADFGILVCGSGQGVAITANKHQGIRAAVTWLTDIAKLSRQHNNANVICIPARFVSPELAKEMVTAFLETPFEGGRHANRVNKISC